MKIPEFLNFSFLKKGSTLTDASKFVNIKNPSTVDIKKIESISKNLSNEDKQLLIDYLNNLKKDSKEGIDIASKETGIPEAELKEELIKLNNEKLDEVIKSLKKSRIVNKGKSYTDLLKMGLKLTVGSGSLATILYYIAGLANSKTNRINNTNYKVISIKKNGPNTAILKYSPAEKLCTLHIIKQITNTVPSTPSIENKKLKITNIIGINELEFELTTSLPEEITNGDLNFEANVQDQMQCSIEDLKESFKNTFNIMPYVIGVGVFIIIIFILQKLKKTNNK